MADALLRVESLSCSYPLPRTWPWQPKRRLQALRDVSFEIPAGKTVKDMILK